jgi:hypothetical protein
MHVMWKLVDRQNHGSCRLVDRQKPPFLILTCIFATFPMHVSWKFVDRQNHGFLRGEGKIGEDKIKKSRIQWARVMLLEAIWPRSWRNHLLWDLHLSEPVVHFFRMFFSKECERFYGPRPLNLIHSLIEHV